MRDRLLILMFVAAAVAAALIGCRKDDPVSPCEPCEPPGEYEKIDIDPKVLIMYDNIGDWFLDDVAEAEQGVASGILAKGHRVIAFQRKVTGGNEIYELVKDSSEKGGVRRKVLKKYASEENEGLSVEIMRNVIADIRALTPEANHYGLAFGSHGSGWIPKGVKLQRRAATPDGDIFAPLLEIQEGQMTRAFQSHWREEMDVTEFADALDEWEWDFILFDDCFMSSVEAMYEMRHLADYFIASPTEIMDRGFPYDRVIKTLFTRWGDYEGIVNGYVNYYLTVKHPDYNRLDPYATVAVVKTKELESLAATVRAIDQSGLWTDVTDPDNIGIQHYEGLATHVFYDLDDYMRHGIAESSAEYSAFKAQLEKTVVFSDHTAEFYSQFSGKIPITHFSGVAVFIPWSGTSSKIPAYRQTSWYMDVYQ